MLCCMQCLWNHTHHLLVLARGIGSSFKFAPSGCLSGAWFHFSSHCPFHSDKSVWAQLLLAKFPAGFTWGFFYLKRRNRSPVFIPASSGKCQILVHWEFAQGKILLSWDKKKEEYISLFPKLTMDFGWMLWDSASLDLLEQEKKTQKMQWVGVTLKRWG